MANIQTKNFRLLMYYLSSILKTYKLKNKTVVTLSNSTAKG